MRNLNRDILNIIFQELDIRSQLHFRAICKWFRDKLDVTDLYNIDIKFKNKLTDNIVIQYPKLKLLNAWGNSNITDVTIGQLKHLQTLSAGYNPKITDASVKQLKQLYT